MADHDSSEVEQRAKRPDFVASVILCYLGIDKKQIEAIAEEYAIAVWLHYRANHALSTAASKFRTWKTHFMAFTILEKLKAILGFIVDGKIKHIPVTKIKAIKTVRQRIITLLRKLGIKWGKVQAAKQIARKVVLVVDAAYLGGCVALCLGEAYYRAMILIGQGIDKGVEITVMAVRRLSKVVRKGIDVAYRFPDEWLLVLDTSNWLLDRPVGNLGRPPRRLCDELLMIGQILDRQATKIKTPQRLMKWGKLRLTANGVPQALLHSAADHVMDWLKVPQRALSRKRAREKFEKYTVFEFLSYLEWELGILRFKASPH